MCGLYKWLRGLAKLFRDLLGIGNAVPVEASRFFIELGALGRLLSTKWTDFWRSGFEAIIVRLLILTVLDLLVFSS